MEMKTVFIFNLNREEATALKKLLGNLNDIEKRDKGLTPAEIEMVREFWDLIPYAEDED